MVQSVQGFCPLKIKITNFPDGFRLNSFKHFGLLDPYQPSTFNNCTCMYDTCIFWNIVVDCKSSIKPPLK